MKLFGDDKMMKYLVTLCLLIVSMTACSAPDAALPAASPSPARTAVQRTTATLTRELTPSLTPEIQKVITVALRVRDSVQSAPQVEAGSAISLQATFEPVVQSLERRADGSVLSSSTSRWENAPLAQMRVCIAPADQPCDPGNWRPFEALVSQAVTVDWLGPRKFTVWAQFRDPQGGAIPSLGLYQSEAGPQTQLSLQVVGMINPATPMAKLPPPVQTAAASTQTAFPVTGSVMIEDGRCCAGGTAGSQIQLRVAFLANSDAGQVTEMKVQTGSACAKDPAQLRGDWQPFQPAQSYPTTLAVNWVGWWVSVQYRDLAGNLSPVYCDDISLEGSPAATP